MFGDAALYPRVVITGHDQAGKGKSFFREVGRFSEAIGIGWCHQQGRTDAARTDLSLIHI